jgi:hypothetical protein
MIRFTGLDRAASGTVFSHVSNDASARFNHSFQAWHRLHNALTTWFISAPAGSLTAKTERSE